MDSTGGILRQQGVAFLLRHVHLSPRRNTRSIPFTMNVCMIVHQDPKRTSFCSRKRQLVFVPGNDDEERAPRFREVGPFALPPTLAILFIVWPSTVHGACLLWILDLEGAPAKGNTEYPWSPAAPRLLSEHVSI